MFLAGSLVTLVLGITANLLTPGMKPLWATVVSWQRRGIESQTRQNLRVLRNNLDRMNRFEAADRDLYLYLFRWLLGIIALLVAALACAFLSAVDTTTPVQKVWLTRLSFIFAILAIACCGAVLAFCSDCTVAGMQKRKAQLEADIAKLCASLPESSQQ